MKTLSLLLGLVAMSTLGGCVGIVPVPPAPGEQPMGCAITPEQLKFIVPGRTTKNEVVSRLGDDFRGSPREPVIAYSWETPTWGYAYWFFFITPYGAIYGGEHIEGNDWRALYLKFDHTGSVETTCFAKLDNNVSLDQQMENWANPKLRGLGGFLKEGAGVFDPDTGVPLPFEWMNKNTDIEVHAIH